MYTVGVKIGTMGKSFKFGNKDIQYTFLSEIQYMMEKKKIHH